MLAQGVTCRWAPPQASMQPGQPRGAARPRGQAPTKAVAGGWSGGAGLPAYSGQAQQQSQAPRQPSPPSEPEALPDTSSKPGANTRSTAAPMSAAAGTASMAAELGGQTAAPNNGKPHMPVSLFVQFGSALPADGHTLTPDEEHRSEDKRPKTAVHVWESKCKACTGTGTTRSSRGGRSRGRGARATLSTCLVCHGIGYVRHGSSKEPPADLNNGGPNYTLGRPPAPEPKKESKSLWDRLRGRQ